MKKETILDILNGNISNSIYNNIEKALDDFSEYCIDVNLDRIRIHTIIEERDHGFYQEIICANNNSVVITKKVYAPTEEVRYGYRTGVALDMFTQSYSYVYDINDRLLYQSFFSDDNEYYGSDRMPLDYSRESMISYFSDTTPEYDKGYLVSLPNSMYKPFSNIWQRYGNTNVIREYGRNPIKGEYSEIKITFDDDSREDISLLCESYGNIFSHGKEMKLSDIDQIVEEIDRIYKESKMYTGFDIDYFMDTFNNTMFVNSKSM